MATLKITLVMAIGPQWPFLAVMAVMAVMTMANGMVPSPRALKNSLMVLSLPQLDNPLKSYRHFCDVIEFQTILTL